MRCLYSYGYVKQKNRDKDMKAWKERVKVLRNKVYEGLQWYNALPVYLILDY